MPELPEVETICRGLQPHLAGRRILNVKVRERRLRSLVDRKLAQCLEGKTILRVGRIAKYILISLSGDVVWMVHLGMSGKLVHVDPETPKQKHDHILVSLDSGRELRYHDPRRFGLSLVVAASELHDLPQLKHLGLDPFDSQIHRLLSALVHEAFRTAHPGSLARPADRRGHRQHLCERDSRPCGCSTDHSRSGSSSGQR